MANGSSAWYNGRTPNGYLIPEVSSALQKCIRRGMADDAMFWAVEMYVAGFAEYVWKRMSIMVSEDIGLAEPTLPASFEALYSQYNRLKQKKEAGEPERIKFAHAVLLLAAARKSRTVDNALCHHFVLHAELAAGKPMMDEAIDKHTPRGKAAKRGIVHFVEVGSVLADERTDPIDVEYDKKFKELCITRWAAAGEKAGDPMPVADRLPQKKAESPSLYESDDV